MVQVQSLSHCTADAGCVSVSVCVCVGGALLHFLMTANVQLQDFVLGEILNAGNHESAKFLQHLLHTSKCLHSFDRHHFSTCSGRCVCDDESRPYLKALNDICERCC